MEDTTEQEPPRREGKQAGRILVESVAIFLSVLLAFFVEQWREDRNELREAEAALELVRAELRQNLVELERVAPQRPEMLQDFIDAMSELEETGTFPQNFPRLETPEITTIAYDLATDSGAVTTVPAEELLVIAQAYEALDKVKRNDIFLNERNAQIRFKDAEQYISGFIYYVNRAISNEPAAIEDVKDALELLDA
jgi:hypothetical protein